MSEEMLTCEVCQGSGCNGHPDSGDLRYKCKGAGGYQPAMTGEEAEEVARVAAAAPQMLKAMERFVMHYPNGMSPFLDDAFREARAAIKKAKGEDYDE